MWDDSPTMVPCWWRKPVVEVCLHSVPSKVRKHNLMVGLGCAVALTCDTEFYSDPFCLPSIHWIQWPDVSRALSVSRDDDSFPRPHSANNVVHSTDDGDFGETHHCILKVLRFLQCLYRLRTAGFIALFPHTSKSVRLISCTYWPPAPTSWLGISVGGRRTPDSSTSSTSAHCLMITNIRTKINTIPLWPPWTNMLTTRGCASPLWSPETVNFLGLCPVHSPT